MSRFRPAKPRAVLFDLDGTLIDSVPDITVSVAELMASCGLPSFSEHEVRGMVGYGVRVLVQRAFTARSMELEGERLELMVTRMMGIYRHHLVDKTVLMPGAEQALDALSEVGANLALVTNKPHSAAETILEHFRLRSRFALVLGDATPTVPATVRNKPHPDMLNYALAQLGTHPAEAVMVGDSPADMDSAAAAAVYSVAVRGGYAAIPVEDMGPNAIIDTLADLGGLFGGHLVHA